jgi:glycosyltransferase involved in cell wall biosynthesis
LIALLGRRDTPTDGLEDYCTFLGEALSRRGVALQKVRVDCAERGWTRALFQLWREAGKWRGQWVLLQFTSLAWSHRGFPFAALAALLIVRSRGARAGVVYHESLGFEGHRLIDRVRGACQLWVLRGLYNLAERPVFADPLGTIPWLPSHSAKAVSIPIGGNLPVPPRRMESLGSRNGAPKVVAIYCVSEPPYRAFELEDISRSVAPLASNGLKIRIVFLGRGTPESKTDIENAFREIPVEVLNLGIRRAEEVSQILGDADAMLCVRGRLFPRRGSALAGITCGLPIVAYAGAAEGTPLAEAGVELVPYRDVAALSRSLGRILTDPDRWRDLHLRSVEAHEKYFSWDAIADQFVIALGVKGT